MIAKAAAADDEVVGVRSYPIAGLAMLGPDVLEQGAISGGASERALRRGVVAQHRVTRDGEIVVLAGVDAVEMCIEAADDRVPHAGAADGRAVDSERPGDATKGALG